MKRVSYRCRAFHEFARVIPTDARPDDVQCGCGEAAAWTNIELGYQEPADGGAPYAFVKGRPYEFKKQYEVMPQGYHYGVPDHVHNARYKRRFEALAKESSKFRSGHSKLKTETPQYLGAMSAEMVNSIGLQERDPEAVSKDPLHFLKSTGNYVGE